MLIPNLQRRQYGLPVRLEYKLNLPDVQFVAEKLTCTRHDEHHIEAQEEDGDLIPPLACGFSKVDPHTLAVADEDGGLLIFNTHKMGYHAVTQSWRAHENAVFDLDWVPQEDMLLTASGDQSVILWDVTREEKLMTFRGHTGSVKTIRTRVNDKHVFATGSRDGSIMLFDRRVRGREGTLMAVNTIHNAHTVTPQPGSSAKKRRSKASQSQESGQSVTAVVFQDEFSLISSGSVDGSVKVWDMRKNYTTLKTEPIPKHRFTYAGNSVRSHGFSSLVLDSSGTRLYASCMDNIIYQYHCGSYVPYPVAFYRGHRTATFFVKMSLSPDDRFLISGSTDHNAFIWKVDSPQASPLTLRGHSGEVSSVAWCPEDFTKVVTVSDDSCVRIWRVHTGMKDQSELPGETVGNCERLHKEIGVGVIPDGINCSPKVATFMSPIRTPRLGNVLPHTVCPMLSPAAHNSLISMATGSPIARQQYTPRLVTRSIKKFFSPSPAKKCSGSPMKGSSTPVKSPRKLNVILSPRKRVRLEEGSENSSQTATDVKVRPIKSLQLYGNSVKRKRKRSESSPDDHAELPPAKKMERIQDENIYSSPRTPKSPGWTRSEARILASRENRNSSSCHRKLAFGESKHSSSDVEVQFQSPTINLPNYVLDPQPRTPVSSRHASKSMKSPDWLTQIRIGLDGNSREDCSPDVKVEKSETVVMESPCTPRSRMCRGSSPACSPSSTPKSTKRKSLAAGTRSSPRHCKTPTLGRKSILHYFSPKDKCSPTTRSSTLSPYKKNRSPRDGSSSPSKLATRLSSPGRPATSANSVAPMSPTRMGSMSPLSRSYSTPTKCTRTAILQQALQQSYNQSPPPSAMSPNKFNSSRCDVPGSPGRHVRSPSCQLSSSAPNHLAMPLSPSRRLSTPTKRYPDSPNPSTPKKS